MYTYIFISETEDRNMFSSLRNCLSILAGSGFRVARTR